MKWEDSFKEALENRTIEPSDVSWETLAKKLDAVDKRKNRRLFRPLSIAASVAAILFTVSIILKDGSEIIEKPAFVDTQEHIDNESPIEKLPQQEQMAGNYQDVETLESTENNGLKNKHNAPESNLVTGVKKEVRVAKNEKQKSLNSTKTEIQNETLEDQKITELVAQIEDLKGISLTVTDADIEALLRRAQKEIAVQSILSDAVAGVNAKSMLQGVESDLEQSFRNRILETLKNGYDSLKTAVADRNN